MKIGIDARLYGLEHAGIGRYVMNLVDRLIQDPTHQWVLFLSPHYVPKFAHHSNVAIIPTTVKHYSLSEQYAFLNQLNQQKLDLLHVPHFNVPLLYRRPLVVTIHDILWHQIRGGSVTTLPPILYYAKYAGYLLTVRHAVSRAQTVFVPSNYVRDDIIRAFPNLDQKKIIVTYEGIDEWKDSGLSKKSPSSSDRLIYIGSAYPHKNITALLQACAILRATSHTSLTLTIVGSRSIFLDKIKQEVRERGLTEAVTFAGYQTDAAVKELLRRSTCLVHPSKSEGFGLTGLEAMAVGTPVIAANATALPEIYGDAALYFHPDKPQDLAKKIHTLITSTSLREQHIQKGLQRVRQFSWDDMVSKTKGAYYQL